MYVTNDLAGREAGPEAGTRSQTRKVGVEDETGTRTTKLGPKTRHGTRKGRWLEKPNFLNRALTRQDDAPGTQAEFAPQIPRTCCIVACRGVPVALFHPLRGWNTIQLATNNRIQPELHYQLYPTTSTGRDLRLLVALPVAHIQPQLGSTNQLHGMQLVQL